MRKKNTRAKNIIWFLLVFLLFGCGPQVYMLDAPVNDPIMFARENQNSDLCRVEDGSYSGSSGECPT